MNRGSDSNLRRIHRFHLTRVVDHGLTMNVALVPGSDMGSVSTSIAAGSFDQIIAIDAGMFKQI